jgi:hypothetical protein
VLHLLHQASGVTVIMTIRSSLTDYNQHGVEARFPRRRVIESTGRVSPSAAGPASPAAAAPAQRRRPRPRPRAASPTARPSAPAPPAPPRAGHRRVRHGPLPPSVWAWMPSCKQDRHCQRRHLPHCHCPTRRWRHQVRLAIGRGVIHGFMRRLVVDISSGESLLRYTKGRMNDSTAYG